MSSLLKVLVLGIYFSFDIKIKPARRQILGIWDHMVTVLQSNTDLEMKIFYWWILKILGSPNRHLLVHLSHEVTHRRRHLATTEQSAALGGCFPLYSLGRQEGSRLSGGKEGVKWEQLHWIWSEPYPAQHHGSQSCQNGMSFKNGSHSPDLSLLALCLRAQGAAFSHESASDPSNQYKHLDHPLAGLIILLSIKVI